MGRKICELILENSVVLGLDGRGGRYVWAEQGGRFFESFVTFPNTSQALRLINKDRLEGLGQSVTLPLEGDNFQLGGNLSTVWREVPQRHFQDMLCVRRIIKTVRYKGGFNNV